MDSLWALRLVLKGRISSVVVNTPCAVVRSRCLIWERPRKQMALRHPSEAEEGRAFCGPMGRVPLTLLTCSG